MSARSVPLPPLTPTRILKGLHKSIPGMPHILLCSFVSFVVKGLALSALSPPPPAPRLPPNFTQGHPIHPRIGRGSPFLANHQIPTIKYQDLSANRLFSKTLYRSHPEALREYSVIG